MAVFGAPERRLARMIKIEIAIVAKRTEREPIRDEERGMAEWAILNPGRSSTC